MKEQPNYYCIIPSYIRYDNELTSSEKLFYGEITALSSKTGECWASNSYFSNLYGVKNNTISNWVTKLKDKGYINVRYEMEGKEVKKRIIELRGVFLSGQSIDRGVVNISEQGGHYNEQGGQSIGTGWSLNDEENNINSNNINSSSIKDNNINANRVGALKDLIEHKILDVFTNYDIHPEEKLFQNALESYKELGGFNGISESMEWDSSQQNNWWRVLGRIENQIKY